MKVIAKVDPNRVLCEVSVEELVFLNGYKSRYDQGCDINTLSQVGVECNLIKMVNTSRFVRSLRKDVLIKSKKDLENAIEKIDSTIEEVTKLELFEVLKNDELTQIG